MLYLKLHRINHISGDRGMAHLSFSYDIESLEEVTIVRIQGEIDVYHCPELNKAMAEVVENGAVDVMFDLKNVSYIDSTGLGSIAHVARSVGEREGRVSVVSDNPQVKKLFEMSGLVKKNIELFDEERSVVLRKG